VAVCIFFAQTLYNQPTAMPARHYAPKVTLRYARDTIQEIVDDDDFETHGLHAGFLAAMAPHVDRGLVYSVLENDPWTLFRFDFSSVHHRELVAVAREVALQQLQEGDELAPHHVFLTDRAKLADMREALWYRAAKQKKPEYLPVPLLTPEFVDWYNNIGTDPSNSFVKELQNFATDDYRKRTRQILACVDEIHQRGVNFPSEPEYEHLTAQLVYREIGNSFELDAHESYMAPLLGTSAVEATWLHSKKLQEGSLFYMVGMPVAIAKKVLRKAEELVDWDLVPAHLTMDKEFVVAWVKHARHYMLQHSSDVSESDENSTSDTSDSEEDSSSAPESG
jgi:hypothetical protein